MTESEIAMIARRQLADYDARRQGLFTDVLLRLTIEEAYAVQIQTAALRAARGEAIAGYKIGCVSQPVQRQLGLNQPAFGRLFATELYRSGTVFDPGAFQSLAIEGEFALRIAEDIPSGACLLDHPERWIGSAFPVIELHNGIFRGATPTAQELVVNNAMHAGVVLPSVEDPLGDPSALLCDAITVFRNAAPLGTATGSAIPGGPIASVAKVAEHLVTCGSALRRGDIVLTGSPLPLYKVEPGDRIVVRSSAATEVEMATSQLGRSERADVQRRGVQSVG
jgi:2-keto-4-pentenoate hydratase